MADWAERCLVPRGRPKVIGVFEAYLDESGIEEPYCAVAGFVGLTTRWRPFEAAWRRALDAAGVEVFHATEFFAGSKPFDALRPDVRQKLITALVGLVTDKDTGLHLVAAAVDVSAFSARTEAERIYLTGGRWGNERWAFSGAPSRPYYLPLCNVLDKCNRSSARVDIFHDQQDVYAKHVLKLHAEMKKYRKPDAVRAGLGALTFADKKDYLPLQAADLAAFLTFCRVAYGKQRNNNELGRASQAFGRFGDRAITYYDEASIDSHLVSALPRGIREGRALSQVRAAKRRARGRERQRARQQIPKPKVRGR